MTKKDKYKPNDKEQSKAFIKKAREIGADEDKSESDELMKQLAQKRPQPRRKGLGNQ